LAAGQRDYLLDRARHAVREVQLKLYLKAAPAAIAGAVIGANDAIRTAANGPRTNGRPILDPVPQLTLDPSRDQVDAVLAQIDAASGPRGPLR
jgi:hypothetical protein